MAVEAPLPKSDFVWRPHHDVREQVVFQDRSKSLTQLLQLHTQNQLPWFTKQIARTSPDAIISPHEPMDQATLIALVGNMDTKWLNRMFYQTGENGIGTGIGWGFRQLPNGYEVEFQGVLLDSTPGHLTIVGADSLHLDVSQIDGHVENQFQKAIREAIENRSGLHRISVLNLNKAVTVENDFTPEYEF